MSACADRDVEQCVGRLAAVGKLLQQLALRGDRALVIAPRVLRIADPVLRRRRERAARIRLDESVETGDCAGVVAALELVERAVVRALLGDAFRGISRGRRRCNGDRRRSGWPAAATPVEAPRRAERRRQHWRDWPARPFQRAGSRRRLDLAQSRVEVDVQVALALLRLLELVGDDLDLSAQLRDIALQDLHLVGEVGEALSLHLLLERRQPVLDLALQLRQADVRRFDPPARFVIVEKCCLRNVRDEEKRDAGERGAVESFHRAPLIQALSCRAPSLASDGARRVPSTFGEIPVAPPLHAAREEVSASRENVDYSPA